MSARIQINKAHFPVTTLGYGKRVGIWVQGCSIQCPGCISRDTWAFREDTAIPVNSFVDSLGPWLARADGVTLSGGEPFDQPEALSQLIAALRTRCSGDILVYSGYSRDWLFARRSGILQGVDVLISEPYLPAAGASLALRGSDNQRIVLLTPLARQRYPADIDQRAWEGQRGLDIMPDGATVWMAGIPRPGELARLKQQLAEAGLDCAASDNPDITIRA